MFDVQHTVLLPRVAPEQQALNNKISRKERELARAGTDLDNFVRKDHQGQSLSWYRSGIKERHQKVDAIQQEILVTRFELQQ